MSSGVVNALCDYSGIDSQAVLVPKFGGRSGWKTQCAKLETHAFCEDQRLNRVKTFTNLRIFPVD